MKDHNSFFTATGIPSLFLILFRALSCSAFFADTRKFPFRIKHRP